MTEEVVSVVIATSSRYTVLENLLKSLKDQIYRYFEVILICIEKDEKIQELSEKYGTKLLEDGGRGRCHARNLGIKESEGEIILFLDDDTLLGESYLKLVVEEFKKHPSLGGVGGRPTSPTGSEGYLRLEIFLAIFDFIRHRVQDLRGWEGESQGYVSYLTGCNMAFPSRILREVGGFDENFYGPSAGEDIDLCLRIRKKGYGLRVIPDAPIHHYSIFAEKVMKHRDDPPFFLAVNDNEMYWAVKNHTLKGMGWLFYGLYRSAAALHWSIMTRNPRVFLAGLKGIILGKKRASQLANKPLKG